MRDCVPYPPDRATFLAALISQPDVLEVLDQLRSGEMTVRELKSALHRPRRKIEKAVRTLVLGGLVSGSKVGSWDSWRVDAVPLDGRYRHTSHEKIAVRWLSNLTAWDCLHGR